MTIIVYFLFMVNKWTYLLSFQETENAAMMTRFWNQILAAHLDWWTVTTNADSLAYEATTTHWTSIELLYLISIIGDNDLLIIKKTILGKHEFFCHLSKISPVHRTRPKTKWKPYPTQGYIFCYIPTISMQISDSN